MVEHQHSSEVEGDGTTAQLCEWICSLDIDSVPPYILERAKYLILDGIGCGLVGAHVPWSEQCVESTKAYEPRGQCSTIGYNEQFGPIAAALLNGSFIQATELDDYHSTAPLHSCAALLPALFAAADSQQHSAQPAGTSDSPNNTHLTNGELKAHLTNGHSKTSTDTRPQITGSRFLLAAVIGFETGPRVGHALHGAQMLSRGWHSGSVFGAPAAAAAASKILELSALDTESAIGIACTQAGGLMSAQYEGMIKRMQHAFAARNGLFGALLARSGYVGIKKVMERPYGGFLSAFSQGSGREPQWKIDEVVSELGTRWETERIRVKLHACVGACHGQVECIAKLQAMYPDRFDARNLQKVKSISVGLSEPAYPHAGWAPEQRPLTATGAQMNAAYIGAVQLIDRQVLLAQFADEALDRDEVWDLAFKTTCYHDETFDQPGCACGARVRVEFEDGCAFEEVLNMPKGFDPPVANKEILEKFRKLAGSVVDAKAVAKIERLVLDLESLEDVTALTRQVGRPVGKALSD